MLKNNPFFSNLYYIYAGRTTNEFWANDYVYFYRINVEGEADSPAKSSRACWLNTG